MISYWVLLASERSASRRIDSKFMLCNPISLAHYAFYATIHWVLDLQDDTMSFSSQVIMRIGYHQTSFLKIAVGVRSVKLVHWNVRWHSGMSKDCWRWYPIVWSLYLIYSSFVGFVWMLVIEWWVGMGMRNTERWQQVDWIMRICIHWSSQKGYHVRIQA